jgi:AAA domain
MNIEYTLDDFTKFETAGPEAEDGRLHASYESANDDHGEGFNLEDIIKNGRYELFPDKNGKPDRSRAVWWVANEMQRQGYAQSAMMSVLLDKNNRISEHVYDQGDVNAARRYAAKQISDARTQLGDDLPRIRSIEIRPGQVETFKVSIGNGTVVVDAEALNYFPWFNRAAIAQLRRSFVPVKPKAWSAQVDRALRAAKEPVPLVEEQARRHGTEAWCNEPIHWLVRERLPEQGVGLLSGMYSTFKSFVLLDLCGSVVTGLPFLKARTIRRGGVLVFAAEGAHDLPMRVKALTNHRLERETVDDPDLFKRSKIDLGRPPLSYIGRCRPLLDPKTVDWMIAKAREEAAYFQNQFGLDLVLIGIDTMSAAAGWEDENDAAQAQIVMNHLADVSKATKTFVLAADHFGKDISAGTRGSGVKENSADTILAVLGERDEETNTVDDTRVVVRKQRSGPQGDVFPFEAKLVNMGEDSDHEPLTSRVIDWDVERPEQQEKPKKKTEAQLAMEQAVTEAVAAHREHITVNGSVVEAVREEQVRPFFDEQWRRNRPDISQNALRQARWRGYKELDTNIVRQGTVGGVDYLWYPPSPM